jgi:hypothetical protein
MTDELTAHLNLVRYYPLGIVAMDTAAKGDHSTFHYSWGPRLYAYIQTNTSTN